MMNEFDVDKTEIAKERRYSDGAAKLWILEFPQRKWAATANRRLAFRKINRLLDDRPPTVVLTNGYRLFLFRCGEDRDTFVENFHRGYEARAYGS